MASSTFPVQTSIRPRWPRYVLLIGRLILGGVFVYAAYTKLREPWMLFAMAVNSYQFLPDWGVTLVARGLPWFELALGLILLTGWKLRWTSTVAACLLGFFFTLMLYTYIKNPNSNAIHCGCFGFGEKLGPLTLLRDGALLALALILAGGSFVTPARKG
jgi:putative oxidoreductase